MSEMVQGTGEEAAETQDAVVTLSLHDLLPDANGEIVIQGTGGALQLSILSEERVCETGIAEPHLTAAGVDVAGLAYYAFEGGTRLYAPSDVAITVASTNG
ncbi:MAG: hypothetical protein IRY94_15855 [Rhodospirillaceae bacterium]|nr:hypothetical protein [Rhodospirillaceae bacterium]